MTVVVAGIGGLVAPLVDLQTLGKTKKTEAVVTNSASVPLVTVVTKDFPQYPDTGVSVSGPSHAVSA